MNRLALVIGCMCISAAIAYTLAPSAPTPVCTGNGPIQGAADYFDRCMLRTARPYIPIQHDPAHVTMSFVPR